MSSVPSPIRVLAVDDHRLIRVGITTLLLPESVMKLVAKASNGRDAIAKFRECRPNVTLMDLQMPEINGLMRSLRSAMNSPRRESSSLRHTLAHGVTC